MALLKLLTLTLASSEFLLLVKSIAFAAKAFLLIASIRLSLQAKTSKKLWVLIILVLLSSMVIDSSWIINLIRIVSFSGINYSEALFLIRLSWPFSIIQYLFLWLFLDRLIHRERDFAIGKRHITTIIAGVLCAAMVYLMLFYYNTHSKLGRPPYEFLLYQITYFYICFTALSTVYQALRGVKRSQLPKILLAQVKTFVTSMIFPHLLFECMSLNPFAISPTYLRSNYPFISISDLLLTYALYFCAQRMMGLRFLNINNHVESTSKFNFIKDFRNILEQLSYATNSNELKNITLKFFQQAFELDLSGIRLYIRSGDISSENYDEENDEYHVQRKIIVENFITTYSSTNQSILTNLRNQKIFIKDEIEFTNFYDETPTNTNILELLTMLKADVFLPIYEKQTMAGYIILDSNIRPHQFFSNIERDEMIVFANYLGTVIHLLKYRNINALIHQEKDLREELYHKHQEINQYKESIRSFLRTSKERKIGIIFYKNRRFTFGNHAAQELITLDINNQEGHTLTQDLRRLTRDVQDYKTSQTIGSKDAQGNRLMLSALSGLDDNLVIIMVYYPEIADMIKLQVDLLKDPSQWDYLLYLETTPTGQLINQLIPGAGETLLNSKINLLKIALSKKATLLDMHHEDLMPTVDILHHISLRQTLHVLRLTSPEKSSEIAMKLFGINPLFGPPETEPLLAQLNDSGTLYIENVHFLNLETQDFLAEFIKYGFFYILKSEQKIISNVRIICSTPKNLQALVKEGNFSISLFQELEKTSLIMPSLLTLSTQEINDLADGFAEQAIRSNVFKNLLELNAKEKDKLIAQRPVSLQEFKEQVRNLLIQKSNRKKIYHEVEFDPAYSTTDPELFQAVRLGRHALKDIQIMTFLWNKFKNQTKIAALLGVNRSSVNRRYKEYKLIAENEP
ncbi:MAG TPA: sigma 54-interacting transcriptional regulator [Candidatus Babeliaceae bacterium]|nr:sigma 54-interacting transcriptional regulator [Candidatus Babeliaceae bacterium]